MAAAFSSSLLHGCVRLCSTCSLNRKGSTWAAFAFHLVPSSTVQHVHARCHTCVNRAIVRLRLVPSLHTPRPQTHPTPTPCPLPCSLRDPRGCGCVWGGWDATEDEEGNRKGRTVGFEPTRRKGETEHESLSEQKEERKETKTRPDNPSTLHPSKWKNKVWVPRP